MTLSFFIFDLTFSVTKQIIWRLNMLYVQFIYCENAQLLSTDIKY